MESYSPICKVKDLITGVTGIRFYEVYCIAEAYKIDEKLLYHFLDSDEEHQIGHVEPLNALNGALSPSEFYAYLESNVDATTYAVTDVPALREWIK